MPRRVRRGWSRLRRGREGDDVEALELVVGLVLPVSKLAQALGETTGYLRVRRAVKVDARTEFGTKTVSMRSPVLIVLVRRLLQDTAVPVVIVARAVGVTDRLPD